MMTNWKAAFKTGIAIAVVVSIILGAVALGKGRNADANLRRTTRVLCDRAHIIEDVIEGGIAVVTAERKDPKVPKSTHDADDAFIARFNADLAKLRAQSESPDSPCYTGKR